MMSTTLPLPGAYGTLSFRAGGHAHSRTSAPTVLIHGVGLKAAAWAPQLNSLSETHHVIALDMPGHGGSSPLRPGVGLGDFVDWLLAAMDAMRFSTVSLVGHSMGALIVGGFAVLHQERIERVALLNGVFRRDRAARLAVVERSRLVQTGCLDVETPLNRWFPDRGRQRHARSQVSAWLSSVDIEGYAAAYAAFAAGDDTYADGYAGISCPFLAATGTQDLNSTPAMSRAMAATVQQGCAVVLEGHGHMMNLTAPDTVTEILRCWLDFDETCANAVRTLAGPGLSVHAGRSARHTGPTA